MHLSRSPKSWSHFRYPPVQRPAPLVPTQTQRLELRLQVHRCPDQVICLAPLADPATRLALLRPPALQRLSEQRSAH